MPEIVKLTQDEITVLTIAAQGESMMPIGRWKAPIENLIARKLMMRLDGANAVITVAGRAAMKEQDQEAESDLAIVANQEQIGIVLEEAAHVVANAAKYVATLSNTRTQKWADLVARRVLELLPQRKLGSD